MKKKFMFLAILVIFSLVLAACAPKTETPEPEVPVVEEPPAEDIIAPLPQG